MKRSTQELLTLMKQSETLSDYLDEGADDMITADLPTALNERIKKSGKMASEVFRLAAIEKTYGYAILAGKRSPGRNKLLALIFGLSLPPSDAQELLKTTGYPPLYPKLTRDAVILFCLEKGSSLSDVNEILYDMGLELIG